MAAIGAIMGAMAARMVLMPVTVSIGPATPPHHHHLGKMIDKLVHAADAAMYLAKRRGVDSVALTSEVLLNRHSVAPSTPGSGLRWTHPIGIRSQHPG